MFVSGHVCIYIYVGAWGGQKKVRSCGVGVAGRHEQHGMLGTELGSLTTEPSLQRLSAPLFETDSLCSPDYSPASASRILGLQTCTTRPGSNPTPPPHNRTGIIRCPGWQPYCPIPISNCAYEPALITSPVLSYASKLGPILRLFQDYLFLSWTRTTLRCCTILLSIVDRVYDSGPIGFEGAKKILSLRTFMLLLLLSIMGSLSGVSRHVCVLCLPKKSLSYNNQQVCPPTHMCIHTYNTYIVKHIGTTDLPIGQPDGDNFSVESSSSQITLSCVKLI